MNFIFHSIFQVVASNFSLEKPRLLPYQLKCTYVLRSFNGTALVSGVVP